jgi:hypothetical protein
MKQLKNFLLVSGAGQNTGKTTLVTQLIARFSLLEVTAVKITPHIHSLEYPLPLLERGNGFVLHQEIYNGKGKDSSRFLEAGAKKVLLLLTHRESTREAIDILLKHTGTDVPVICESGGLAQFYQPALHLFLKNENQNPKMPLGSPNKFITFNGSEFDADIFSIRWESGTWSWPDTIDI